MIDWSDWVWLGVVVLWLVVKILPRLFGSRAQPSAPPPAEASPRSAEQERVGDVGPRPINPK